MELSMSTIVIIVLSVTLLVGGIIFVTKLMKLSTGVLDMTDAQLRTQIRQLFPTDDKIFIYPQSAKVEIRQGTNDEVGVGIQNLQQGASASTDFSYEVVATDTADCGLSESEVEEWIIIGKEESNIPIAPGDIEVVRVRFRIPEGTPLCIAGFRVNVKAGGKVYDTASFDVEVKGKGIF